MLVLVRVIAPAEYGRAGAVVGVVTLLNAFSFSLFMGAALQLPDDVEPDWSLHWSAGFYIQLTVSAACQLVAFVCWFYPAYRGIAPLVHLAGIGILLDWPNWLGGVMLRRAMNIRRLEILNGVATFLSLGVTLALGVAGGGAYAIVLGGNVARALPFGADLLLVRRWRPEAGWWRWPDWKAYRPALRFGLADGVGASPRHSGSARVGSASRARRLRCPRALQPRAGPLRGHGRPRGQRPRGDRVPIDAPVRGEPRGLSAARHAVSPGRLSVRRARSGVCRPGGPGPVPGSVRGAVGSGGSAHSPVCPPGSGPGRAVDGLEHSPRGKPAQGLLPP